jgi:hypothetical protein
MWFEMLAHLESTKVIKFLPKGSVHFRGVNTTKVGSLIANEDDVASSFNLEDMCQREALLIGCSSWHGRE